MKVSGERTFNAPRPVVWRVLNDPTEMAKLTPGVESFEVQDERNWSAKVKIPLGLGAVKMSIGFEKTGERKPEFASLQAKGRGVGALLSMATQFHLSEGDSGGTHMRWEADVRIAGQVGSMGQRVLQPILNEQVRNVLAALDQRVAAASAGS
jgi:carbon monoxide dehydrogenase subunit G